MTEVAGKRGAAGYVRVSQVGSRGGDTFLSPELQRERITAWAEYRQVPVVAWYTDLDVSGRTGVKRPEFERLMADARDHRFTVVAVYRLTRFGRSVKDAATRYEELRQLGIDLVSVTEDIDTSTAGGKFMRNMLFAMAEFESERIGEEWRGVHANRRRRGLAQATRGVFGYRVEGSVPAAVEDAEARAVREVFQRRAHGASITELRDWLHAEGYRPKRGGDRFSKPTVSRMLRNPLYAGQVKSGDTLVDGQHPAIISRELYDQVQRLWTRTNQVNRYGRGYGSGLCSGLAVCAGCGYRMTAWQSQGYSWYRCPAYAQSRECPAPTVIRMEKLDTHVEAMFLRSVDPRRMRNRGRVSRRASWAERERRLEKRIADHATAIDRLTDERYLVGGLSADDYQRQVERLIAERARAQSDLDEARALAARDAPAVVDWSDAWPRLPLPRRQAILRRAVERVTVHPGRRGGPQPAMSKRAVITWVG